MMLIVIAEKLPPAVRGKFKLWFVEPKPNVFVAGVSDALAEQIVEELLKYCGDEAGLLVIRSQREAPGYKIFRSGITTASVRMLSGMQVIAADKSAEGESEDSNCTDRSSV